MFKRLLQLILLATVSFSLLGAATPSKRFDKVGHKLMCTCGCAEILLECNHVGCPDSSKLIQELHTQVDANVSDDAIFNVFAAKYGPTVLAAPFRAGFDQVAWIVPFAILVLGILGILLLLRVWKKRYANLPTPVSETHTQETDALRDRIRNETNYGE
jgi:cytochrome c-type biogenesis protein CcmH/NrfF